MDEQLAEVDRIAADAAQPDFENTIAALERTGRASDRAGLPESLRSAAAAAAEARGERGRWAVLNTRSSVEPFLTYADRRDLRERVWREFASRGDNDDARDNKRIIAEIVRLRDERAK